MNRPSTEPITHNNLQVVNNRAHDEEPCNSDYTAGKLNESKYCDVERKTEVCEILIPGRKEFLINGLIQGTPLTWKIDTGARKTFITEETFYSIPVDNRPVLEQVKSKFLSADGRKLKILGTAKMILTLKDIDIEFRVFVGGVTHDLLGEDFIVKFKCNWNYELCALSLAYNQEEGAYVNEVCPTRKIYNLDSVSIPGRHEIVVRSVLKNANGEIGIPMPLTVFVNSYKLGVARTLIDAKNTELYIRLYNPGDREITVPRNTEIALFVPVTYVSQPFCDKDDVVAAISKRDTQELPEYLKPVYENGIVNLNSQESEKFKEFLYERRNVFADPDGVLQRTSVGEHRIKLSDGMPFKEAPRRVPLFKREILDQEIGKLLDQGIIEKSSSPWSSQLVLVQKKDKSWRVCVDYRRLNAKTIKDAYPIPRIDDNLDALAGSVWFSSLDLNMAYHQVPMSNEDKEKTAFATPRGGLYQYNVMPFGLCNAPATFQRIIERTLSGLQWNVAVLYLDDIIVYGKSFDEHLENLKKVLDRLDGANLRLKAKKCSFFKKEVSFLGYVVSETGIKTDPAKTESIEKIPTPNNVTELRSFLGLVSYYRKYIKDFASIAKCLHSLTSKNNKWIWTEECDRAFEELKKKLQNAPILGYPDINDGSFILDTDASNEAIGCVLSQIQNGREKVIAYGSRTLSSAEKNYCVTRKEMLAVIYFVKYYKHYLLGREFILRTDHGSLTWLHKFKEPDGQICRWLQQLGPYNFTIIHRAGKQHANADALSRLPKEGSTEGMCKQCKENHKDYDGDFVTRVKDLRENSNETKMTNDIICDIFQLFNVTNEEKIDSEPEEVTTKKRKQNRPRRAKQREIPDLQLTYEEIRKQQENDTGIGPILQLFEKYGSENKPPTSEVTNFDPECKFWYNRWEILEIYQRVLCIKWVEIENVKLRICTPKNMRDVVMWYLHDSPVSGHLGIQRIIRKMNQSSYYWPKIREFVTDYVKSCHVCEERKNPQRKKRSAMESFITGGRWERIAADIAGPFPKSESGNVYILVVADYFTKFVEIFPIPNMEAETVANVIFKGWIKRYGCPYALHTDQGRQFESQLFQNLCSLLGIHKTRTTPFHPRSDGMVERLNRTIKDMLSKYISLHQNDWDKFIDGISMAYNSTVHETTGISPFRMLYGSEMVMPVNLFCDQDNSVISDQINYHKYVRELKHELEQCHEVAREETKKNSQNQKRCYDLNVKNIKYCVGDTVCRFQPQQILGTKLKLARNWSGPWIVTKKLSDVLYRIQHSIYSKPVVIHADNLKPLQVNKTVYLKLQRIIRQCPEGDSDVIIPNLYPSDEVAGENNEDHSDISENSESQTTLPDTDKMQKLPLERSREENDGHLSPPKQMEQKKTRHGRIIKTPTRFRT